MNIRVGSSSTDENWVYLCHKDDVFGVGPYPICEYFRVCLCLHVKFLGLSMPACEVFGSVYTVQVNIWGLFMSAGEVFGSVYAMQLNIWGCIYALEVKFWVCRCPTGEVLGSV